MDRGAHTGRCRGARHHVPLLSGAGARSAQPDAAHTPPSRRHARDNGRCSLRYRPGGITCRRKECRRSSRTATSRPNTVGSTKSATPTVGWRVCRRASCSQMRTLSQRDEHLLPARDRHHQFRRHKVRRTRLQRLHSYSAPEQTRASRDRGRVSLRWADGVAGASQKLSCRRRNAR